MQRIPGFVLSVFIALILNLHAESDGYQQWLKRRDALEKDASVARYYTFEDVTDSKSIVKDLSGNGADLVFIPYTDRKTKKVYDDLRVTAGRWKEKKAVRLDRGYYRGPSYNMEKGQFSAEVWFRRQGQGSEPPPRVSLSRGHILSVEGYRRGWRIITAYEPVSGTTFSIGGEGGSDRAGSNVSAKTPMADNTWQHLAVTWDGRKMKLYHNGLLAGEKEYGKEYIPVVNPDSFKLGFAKMGLGTVILDIDEVVIYNRVLTGREIEELSKGPSGMSAEEIFDRADAFTAKGDHENARREYEKLKMLPDNGKELALFNMAESYRLEKDYANVHRTFSEIFAISGLTPYYRIYGLFRQADVYLEQKNYDRARHMYEEAGKTEGAADYHIFTSRLKTGDTYRYQRRYSDAAAIYTGLLKEEEALPFPNDGNRLKLRDRLEEIEGLADGAQEKGQSLKLQEWINSPGRDLYVSPGGSDDNPGVKERPFATIQRAQEEVRRIKEAGMPEGGINVYLGEGSYFLSKPLRFSQEDSGAETSPVVYRSCPGEDARIVGGTSITNFVLLSDESVLERLPEESRGKVYVADLKEAGMTDYGKLVNRGYGAASPAAMELIYNGRIMTLARWPNEGWLRVAGLPNPKGDYTSRGSPYQLGKFIYSGDRPERWKEEKEIWLKGYLGPRVPFVLKHLKVTSIDTEKKIVHVAEDPRWEYRRDPNYGVGFRIAAKEPYFAYNILSELDMPGEWYLDREKGKLYFYPPGRIEGSEVIGTLSEVPLLSLNNASNLVFYGLTVEGGRSHAFEMQGGRNNLVAASVIRNTGQWAVQVQSGWEHKVIGCDIHDVGEGGVALDGGDRQKLIPARHLVENNHIYRFNRFDGGYRQALQINGTGQIVSHNVIHDSPHQAIYFNANDHVIEFNDIHDAPHEGREIGAIYVYGADWLFLNRGTVIRNNFFHHICTHSSPNLTHGLNAIHLDAVNADIVIEDNIFYRFPQGISSTQPGNYLTNNVFIEGADRAIGQGDRSALFCNNADIDAGPNISRMNDLSHKLKSVRYKQPPWNYRYPRLLNLLESEPSTWGINYGSVIERNVNTGGRFISFGRGIKATTLFKDNWDGGDILFVDRENMDFNIRPGSQVFGVTGCRPVDVKKAGVYKDELRASWPINRKKEDIGKYYKPDWSSIGEVKMTMGNLSRVYPPLEYKVPAAKKPIEIDGKLKKDEWAGLDKNNAMLMERDHAVKGKKGPRSYAWLLHDNECLYIATLHEPDPWTKVMPLSAKEHSPAFEVSIESQTGPHSRGWWMEDMPTGPIYIVWGYFNGKHQVMNPFKMPFGKVKALEESIEYKVNVINEKTGEWTSEMKIPFPSLGIGPSEAGKLCFNIGTWKRGGWVVWVPTGGSVWRLENAGFIKFSQ